MYDDHYSNTIISTYSFNTWFICLFCLTAALATVTPSFVTFGAPNGCSMTTFRPWAREKK